MIQKKGSGSNKEKVPDPTKDKDLNPTKEKVPEQKTVDLNPTKGKDPVPTKNKDMYSTKDKDLDPTKGSSNEKQGSTKQKTRNWIQRKTRIQIQRGKRSETNKRRGPESNKRQRSRCDDKDPKDKDLKCTHQDLIGQPQDKYLKMYNLEWMGRFEKPCWKSLESKAWIIAQGRSSSKCRSGSDKANKCYFILQAQPQVRIRKYKFTNNYLDINKSSAQVEGFFQLFI